MVPDGPLLKLLEFASKNVNFIQLLEFCLQKSSHIHRKKLKNTGKLNGNTQQSSGLQKSIYRQFPIHTQQLVLCCRINIATEVQLDIKEGARNSILKNQQETSYYVQEVGMSMWSISQQRSWLLSEQKAEPLLKGEPLPRELVIWGEPCCRRN